MSYTAQELNTRVELQRFTTTTNDFGEEIKAWTTYGQAFAKVESLVGREYVAAGAEAGEVNLKVTMRWRADTTRLDRVIVRGKAFEIIDAQDIKFQRRELLLYCKRIE